MSIKKNSGRVGTWRVLTNIYFKCLCFIYCSSLCGLHLFTGGEGQTEGLGGGGGQGQFHFYCHGGGLWEWGVQNKFEQKIGGVKAIFFFYNLSPDYFFSNVRIRQEGGMIQDNLKNSGRVGTWGF